MAGNLQAYITSNDLLVDHSSKLALTVASTAREILERSARINEAAHSLNSSCFGIDHRAVQCRVGISGADVQLVGLASDKRSTIHCGDYDALHDRCDLVDGMVCESEGNQQLDRSSGHSGVLTERSYNVCGISWC
jgi:hypothetical protein